jgi:hypothetical protein
MSDNSTSSNSHNYEAIAKETLTQSGKLCAAYRYFHRYSIGNQFLAIMQLAQAEPINTYNGWKELGRQVKKGSKAIALLMPCVSKDKVSGEVNGMFFIRRNNWFGLSQTEGDDYVMPETPSFDMANALVGLGITTEHFSTVNGNAQGYAKPNAKTIAVSALAANPLKTHLHEIAHCLLHADDVLLADSAELPNTVIEVEAELTAYVVLSVLGITEGLEYSRGYIANWNSGNAGEKVRYGKVFSAVDAILKARPHEIRSTTRPNAASFPRDRYEHPRDGRSRADHPASL